MSASRSMCTTKLVADLLRRVAAGGLQHPEASMATWPWGSVSTAKMSAAGAGMVRLHFDAFGHDGGLLGMAGAGLRAIR